MLLQVHLAMHLILLQAALENNQYLNKECQKYVMSDKKKKKKEKKKPKELQVEVNSLANTMKLPEINL